MSIHHMRQTYTKAGISLKDVNSDPLVQFSVWFEQAKAEEAPDWMEINAMTLSTASVDGNVTSRIVLLKAIENGKFAFFTNYDSVKGQQIAANPNVSLCFFWPHLERQIRIDGTAAKTSRETSQTYFASRPRDSQLGANASDQSSEVQSEQWLTDQMDSLRSRYEGESVPCPPHWGGYDVTPNTIEFWQGRPSRLHDRIVYKRDADSWKIVRLAP
ncbi:MAG: pyridoxamine 5'-phosphate oxidase [Rubripirellula sp.]